MGCIDGNILIGVSLGLYVGDRLLGFVVIGLELVGLRDGLLVMGCIDGDMVLDESLGLYVGD